MAHFAILPDITQLPLPIWPMGGHSLCTECVSSSQRAVLPKSNPSGPLSGEHYPRFGYWVENKKGGSAHCTRVCPSRPISFVEGEDVLRSRTWHFRHTHTHAHTRHDLSRSSHHCQDKALKQPTRSHDQRSSFSRCMSYHSAITILLHNWPASLYYRPRLRPLSVPSTHMILQQLGPVSLVLHCTQVCACT